MLENITTNILGLERGEAEEMSPRIHVVEWLTPECGQEDCKNLYHNLVKVCVCPECDHEKPGTCENQREPCCTIVEREKIE